MIESYKIVASETGSFVVKADGELSSSNYEKGFGSKAESEFVSFFSKENDESRTNSNSTPTPAPSPTPSTGATVSVTGYPADPMYSSGNGSSPFTVSVGYVLLVGLGMYVLGRMHQYFKDEKRGLGPKPPKGGQS